MWNSYVSQRDLTEEGVVPSGSRLAALLFDIRNDFHSRYGGTKKFLGFILVGHSMGGLVTKDAVAAINEGRFSDLDVVQSAESLEVKLLISLDAPHLGLRHTPGRPYQPFPPSWVDATIGEQFAVDLGNDELIHRLERAVQGMPRVYFGCDKDRLVPLKNALACCEDTGRAGGFFEEDVRRKTVEVPFESGLGARNRLWFLSRYGPKLFVEDCVLGGHAFVALWPTWIKSVVDIVDGFTISGDVEFDKKRDDINFDSK